MLFEDGTGVGVDFTEPNGSESGSLKGEAKSADPAEQIKVSWSLMHSPAIRAVYYTSSFFSLHPKNITSTSACPNFPPFATLDGRVRISS